MDRSQLNSLKRSQLQRLARRESLKANLKNVEIVRLLLEKYPGGVPRLTDKPSAMKRSTSLSKAKQPARRSKRKSTAKLGLPSVKVEEFNPSLHAEPTLDEPDFPPKGRDVRSMAPPPVTPTASFDFFRPPALRQLPATPRTDSFFEPLAGDGTGKDVDPHDTGRRSEATPTPPEAAVATSRQAREMLCSLTDIIDTIPPNPEEPSSILSRAKALNAILETTIVPKMMKVDKDVKDIVWMRATVEKHLDPQLKKDILPESSHSEVPNVMSGPSFPAPQSPSPKRPREEGGDQGVPPAAQPCTSKRARIR